MHNLEDHIDSRLSDLELVAGDPEKFETIRSEIIRTAIESFPQETRQRFYGLQFTLDCELRKYKNPIVRMNRMVEIFWDKVYEFNAVLHHPEIAIAARAEKREPAKVIQLFPKQADLHRSSAVK